MLMASFAVTGTSLIPPNTAVRENANQSLSDAVQSNQFLSDAVQSLNVRYQYSATARPGDTPSWQFSGVFLRTGVQDIDVVTKEWLNHRNRNVTSLSYLRSDLQGRGIYGKEWAAPRLGVIYQNRALMQDAFTVLCAYPTDGGSAARTDDGCGSAQPEPGQEWSGQCAALDPPITTPRAWLDTVHTNPSPCGNHFDFFKECSINETMFDELFVPIARRSAHPPSSPHSAPR